MPQLDFYIAFSQVFWFTIIFIVFYIFIVRDILPELARSIKLRKKKVGGDSPSTINLEKESEMVSIQVAGTLEESLNKSRTLLVDVSKSTSAWLDSSLNEIEKTSLSDLNKNYIKTIGELKGRSYLLEQIIKKK